MEEYEATLPDAPRRSQKPLANNLKNPSTGSPQPVPLNSEPWSDVANKQRNDYSDHPYHISDEPK